MDKFIELAKNAPSYSNWYTPVLIFLLFCGVIGFLYYVIKPDPTHSLNTVLAVRIIMFILLSLSYYFVQKDFKETEQNNINKIYSELSDSDKEEVKNAIKELDHYKKLSDLNAFRKKLHIDLE